MISLGTTSQDGNQRQVKVEVLGVMDTESKEVRLRAVEPLQVMIMAINSLNSHVLYCLFDFCVVFVVIRKQTEPTSAVL